MLDLDGERLTKPADMEAARRQLLKLSGRTHLLHSAVACARGGEIVWQHVETAALTMRKLTPAFIGRYLAAVGEEALTSVGGYQLEGRGIQLFEKVDGDFFAILGLPLLPLLAFLRSEGVDRMSARKAFVVGWPIAHSRSPRIHRFWLKRHGIDGDYLPEAVPPDGIEAFLKNFAAKGYVGGNVTLPHKEAASAPAPSRRRSPRKLEAANTLWLEDGRIHGDNTDVYGFTANLDDRAPEWRTGSTRSSSAPAARRARCCRR